MKYLTIKREMETLGFRVKRNLIDNETELLWETDLICKINEKKKNDVTFVDKDFKFNSKALELITRYIATDIKKRLPYVITQEVLIEEAADKILGITIWDDDQRETYKVLEDLVKCSIKLNKYK